MNNLPVELLQNIGSLLVCKQSILEFGLTNRRTYESMLKPATVRANLILTLFDNSLFDSAHFMMQHGMIDDIDALVKYSCYHCDYDEFEYALGRLTTVDCSGSMLLQMTKLQFLRSLIDNYAVFRGRHSDSCLSLAEMVAMAFRWSLYFGETQIVKHLLETNVFLHAESIKCEYEWWLRMLREGNHEIIGMLLDFGVSVQMSEGRRGSDLSSILSLGSAGVDGGLLSPISLRSRQGSFGEGSDDSEENFVGTQTRALVDLTGSGDVEAIRYLLGHVKQFQQRQYRTAAMYGMLVSAAVRNQTSVLALLVDEYSINLNDIDDKSDALTLAVTLGNEDFLEAYNKVVKSQNIQLDLEWLLTQAIDTDRIETVKVLFDMGAHLCANDLHSLEKASERGSTKLVHLLIDHCEKCSCIQISTGMRLKLVAKYNHLCKKLTLSVK